ncbi:GNAT family N-acetyltransferase [Pendulispora albinea]|uniref:GNAT family N-acetyltransferase n=1 Tax=Pendulispora albinea TaxID=2741071 RepID=A0ABZ2M367_9BACT
MSAPDPTVAFRRARREDVPAIVALLADDTIAVQRDAELAEHAPGDAISDYVRAFEAIDLDPRNFLLVAEQHGTIVGTLQLTYIPSLSRRGSERAQVEAVRVHRDLRGRGLGKRMMEWAIDRARERGCRLVQLTTDKRRTDAHRFYAGLGFESSHEGMKLKL